MALTLLYRSVKSDKESKMKKLRRILLLSTETRCTSNLQGPLLVAGYDLVIKRTLDEAINLSHILKNTCRRFELLIAEMIDEESEQLKSLVRENCVGAFLGVYCSDMAAEPYSITGNIGFVYQYSALLVAVREILANVGTDVPGEINDAGTRPALFNNFDNFVAKSLFKPI